MPRLFITAASLFAFGVSFSSAAAPSTGPSTGPSTARPVEFNRDIRPILVDKCYACHGPDAETVAGGLRVDLREEAVDAGAIVPAHPDESELIRRIFSDDEYEIMPPPKAHKVLDTNEKAILTRWIAEGAAYQPHWAYSRLVEPTVPVLERSDKADWIIDWLENPIDQFVAARLISESTHPSEPAERTTLIRRLCFDLTGIPPTPAEVDAFVNDSSSDAYARLVERLLGSPRFGERMAVYWLDLVRYADTVGYHGDQDVSQSPYRDYVIDAFNSNMPYDQFVREQLAGDLLPNPTVNQLVASGYNRLNQTTEEGGAQAKEYLAIYFADRVRNVSQTFMGATVGCAQCHDHKFDPYTAKDFYALGAFFADIEEHGVYPGGNRQPMIPVPNDEQRRRLAELEDPLTELDSERSEFLNRVTQTVISKPVSPREIRILHRGNWMDDSGPVVEPAIPEFLGTLETGDRRANRLDLANWLGDRDNVMTSRTLVNRLWYLMFGRGICASVNDFGGQGTYPANPELLDWLSVDFVDSGWDIKHTLRMIVSSASYQQSSKPSAEMLAKDPYNELFARQGRFPIAAEMVRDSALSISGLLVEQVGGESIKPYQPDGYYAQLNFPVRSYVSDDGVNQYRRGVYMHWQRTFLHPMLKAFDAPSREEATCSRSRSNTPLQALTLLNDPTFVEAARVMAARIMREGGNDTDARIEWAYRQAISRQADPDVAAEIARVYHTHLEHYRTDREAAEKLIATGNAPVEEDLDVAEMAAWTSVSRIIMNLHELITRY